MAPRTTSPSARTDESRERRILVLAPFGRDEQLICATLARHGCAGWPCQTMDAVLAALPRGAAALVLAEEAVDPDKLPELLGQLGEQEDWSEIPVLWLSGKNRDTARMPAVLHRIQEVTQLAILERPLRLPTLVSAVRSAVRSRRRQYQVRDELAARRAAEAALTESKQRLERSRAEVRRQLEEIETIYDSARVGLCVFDREMRWVRINEHLAEINGLPAEAHLGRTPGELLPEMAAKLEPLFQRVLATGETIRDVELSGVTPAQPGVERTWILQWRPLIDAGGRVTAVNVSAEEITRRKRMETFLTRLNEDLERRVAERTATAERRARALRRLAAQLSEVEHAERARLAEVLHDHLQQLLVGAKLQLTSLARNHPDTRSTIARVQDLLGECIAASRDLTVELSPPVLKQRSLVEALSWLADAMARKHGLTVASSLDTEGPELPEHLRVFLFQAVRELLFNTVKHAGVLEADVVLTQEPGWLSIEVRDEGRGFDPAEVERRLEDPEGFGLFNIRERLEALAGRLEIRAAAGGGASFRLIVPTPAAEADAHGHGGRPRPGTATAPPAATPGPIRVLVVDDHRIVREGLVEMLAAQHDFAVVGEAADGLEAIDRAESLEPDVVVMDVNMPGMDGIAATREIVARRPATRVLGLSLLEETEFARAMLDAGAVSYLCKDGAGEALFAAIRAAAPAG
jgi:PAS domain S-box-containing protein